MMTIHIAENSEPE